MSGDHCRKVARTTPPLINGKDFVGELEDEPFWNPLSHILRRNYRDSEEAKNDSVRKVQLSCLYRYPGDAYWARGVANQTESIGKLFSVTM